MIYVIVTLLAALLFLVLFVERGDWLAPASIVTLSFLFSVACAACNVQLWGIDLSLQTTATIFGGVLLFTLFSFLFRNVTSRGSAKSPHEVSGAPVRAIQLSNGCQIALLAFFLFATAVYYWQLRSSFASLGVIGQDWNDMMSTYRTASSDTDLSSFTSMPTWAVYIYNTMHGLAFVVLYVVINNFFSEDWKWHGDVLLIGCCAVYLVSTILRAGRLPVLEYAFATALMTWIIWHRIHGWKSIIHMGYVIVIIVAAIGVLALFSALRWLVGRTNDADFFSYITSYAGGSIQLFDLYLKDPVPSNGIFGQETFRGIVSALGRHFDNSLTFSWQLEFRYSNGIMLGNVYTAFRYWIYDFGYVGWLVMLALYAFIFTSLHMHVKTYNPVGRFDSVLAIYAYIFIGLVMLPIQDVLFAMDFNPGGTYTLICIVFFGWLIIDKSPRQGSRQKGTLERDLYHVRN